MEFVEMYNSIFIKSATTTKFKHKYIGTITGQWYVTIRKPQHIFRKYHGFGLSKDLIKLLLSKKVEKVKIVYKGNIYTTIYRMDLADFLDENKRIPYTDNKDVQYILPIQYMECGGCE